MKWREDSLVRSLTALNELKMMSRYATDAVLFLSSPQVIFQQRPLKTIYDLFQRSVRDGNFFLSYLNLKHRALSIWSSSSANRVEGQGNWETSPSSGAVGTDWAAAALHLFLSSAAAAAERGDTRQCTVETALPPMTQRSAPLRYLSSTVGFFFIYKYMIWTTLSCPGSSPLIGRTKRTL